MTIGSKRPYDVRKVVAHLRSPSPDFFLISAHRGARWNGVPENSRPALARAAQLGLACVEIDVRLTSDGHLVCLHDDGLGRCTNIAEMCGRSDCYSPFTGQGYNPKVDSLPWTGCVDRLKLKDEFGILTEEGVLDLDGMLRFIHDERLDLVVFLDIKGHECLTSAFETVKLHTNHRGVPALRECYFISCQADNVDELEWCVWKYEAKYYPSPVDLENTPWFQAGKRLGLPPLVIPVYETPQVGVIDVMASSKAYSKPPYVISLEVEMRKPGGLLQDLLNYSQSPCCAIKGLGFFAPMGDLPPWTGRPISYDTGDFRCPWDQIDRQRRYAFWENHPPTPFSQLPEADDGVDRRDAIELYRTVGYSWVITDEVEELLSSLRKRGLRDGEAALYVD